MSGVAADRAPLSLAVLVSGNGTNLQAILDAIEVGNLHARVVCVISNRPDVRALKRAKSAGVPAICIPHGKFESRQLFDEHLASEVSRFGADWVVLAGFMRLLSPAFLARFRHRVLNIHPALLPAFPGLHAQRQAFEYGVRVTGCTVHLVDDGMDTGAIVDQRVVAIEGNDTLGDVEARIHAAEHELFVSVLGAIADGRVVVEPSTENGRPQVRVMRK